MIEYCTIELQHGSVARVSPEDWESLCSLKWFERTTHGRTYARCFTRSDSGRFESIYMHRVIASAPRGISVDHANNESLDNRRENLRLDVDRQNPQNSKISVLNKSGYKGVYLDNETGKWRSQIRVRGEKIHLGSFAKKEAAHAAYCEASRLHHGSFGRIA